MASIKNTLHSEILIVEDNQSSLAYLSDLLMAEGYKIRQAQDGEMALVSIANKKPNLILLDVHLPGKSGFDVCQTVKRDDALVDVPIIFLSALQDTEAKVQGLKLGAADYIAKPFEAEEVLQRVSTVLELSRLQHHLEDVCKLRTQQLLDEIAERKVIEKELRASQLKLRELTGHLEDVREQERKRIAREIHDELGQSLTVVKIDLTRLTEHLHLPKGELQTRIEEIMNVLQDTSDIARSISENLRPGILDLLGLGAALEHHVKRFQESTNIECNLVIEEGSDDGIDDRIATIAYRIVQESLTNVARHSQATQVKMQLRKENGRLVVTIHDNGIGIDNSKNESNRFGLLGMAERTQLVGGELIIESPPAGGTRIQALLPMVGEGAQ